MISVTKKFYYFNLWEYQKSVVPFNVTAPSVSVEYNLCNHKHLDLYFFQTVVLWGCTSTAVLFSRSFSENRQCQRSLTCWQREQKHGSIANNSIDISTLLEATQPDIIPTVPCFICLLYLPL